MQESLNMQQRMSAGIPVKLHQIYKKILNSSKSDVGISQAEKRCLWTHVPQKIYFFYLHTQ
jgi:hypothetical protein